MVKGKLLLTEENRETLLALLLENIARIAPSGSATPGVWRAAVAKLGR